MLNEVADVNSKGFAINAFRAEDLATVVDDSTKSRRAEFDFFAIDVSGRGKYVKYCSIVRRSTT